MLFLSQHHSFSSASACLPHAPTPVLCWWEPILSTLPKSALSHGRREARTRPGWENLHHRNWQSANQDSALPENHCGALTSTALPTPPITRCSSVNFLNTRPFAVPGPVSWGPDFRHSVTFSGLLCKPSCPNHGDFGRVCPLTSLSLSVCISHDRLGLGLGYMEPWVRRASVRS